MFSNSAVSPRRVRWLIIAANVLLAVSILLFLGSLISLKNTRGLLWLLLIFSVISYLLYVLFPHELRNSIKDRSHATMITPLLIFSSTLLLSLRNLKLVGLHAYLLLLLWSVLLAALLLIPSLFCFCKRRPRASTFLAFLVFSISTVISINFLLDFSVPDYTPAVVSTIQRRQGPKGDGRYSVTLQTDTDLHTFSIGISEYTSLAPGESVILSTHPGALGISYMTFESQN